VQKIRCFDGGYVNKKAPIVLTRRGERLMLVVCWFSLVLLITYAEELADLLN
jgi:hypothetical protein